jgi:hypothetical protein
MMRAMMRGSDTDDSLLEFMRLAESAPAMCAQPPNAEVRNVGREGKALSWKGAAVQATPAKPAQPDVRNLGKSKLEQAAWEYVHQHQLRSQVRSCRRALEGLRVWISFPCPLIERTHRSRITEALVLYSHGLSFW